jgi:hydrogenase expression/formation protein HypE
MSTRFTLTCPAPLADRSAIELAHGGGGLMTHELIDQVFRPAFGVAPSDFTHDGAVLGLGDFKLAVTTDSYVVQPLFFPGGDIGSLAVYGTVNDLAMCGAEPLCLSAAFVIEEGFAFGDLRRIVASMQSAAAKAGVRLATGDTKVVERGKGDGLYINTTGIGRVLDGANSAPQNVRDGDVVLLSGDIGRHGIAVMSVREGLAFESAIESDSAPVAAVVQNLFDAGIPVHCLRDPTRGGLATSLVEIASVAGANIRLVEQTIAVCEPVRGACEILGLDPLYVANEGRFVAFVPSDAADSALAILRGSPAGEHAAMIGRVEAGSGRVILENGVGSERVLDMLSGEQLPRIC